MCYDFGCKSFNDSTKSECTVNHYLTINNMKHFVSYSLSNYDVTNIVPTLKKCICKTNPNKFLYKTLTII